ncbi:MAG: sugar ABC transporter ATP-binding protein [Bacteroidia bacterium]|nr:sugar ABC transporter ATP-binding protein [Bacteroidia bacterium]
MLQLYNIHKTFGPVRALRGVSLAVRQGEVHAIIGENGAGKSTLMKILSGASQPDRGGWMKLMGQPWQPQNPAEGRSAGIAMIYQELNLAPHLTIEENILLGVESARWGFVRNQRSKVREVLDWLEQYDLSPETKVSQLSIGKKQMVEIARALIAEAQIVIMDEPTSSLAAEDTQTLFRAIRRLKERGISVLYISHFLEEIKEICDRYTVLRDGETVASGEVAGTEMETLITHMVGRSVEELYPAIPHAKGEVVLQVKNLTGAAETPDGISFSLHRGEILGIAGLVGAGRSETIRTLFGLEKAQNGSVIIAGRPEIRVTWLDPLKALHQKLDLLSENRKEEGLALNMSIAANISLSALNRYRRKGFLQLRQETKTTDEWIKTLNIKCRDGNQPIQNLSGGNQQKACIARLLHHNSDVFFLDEPTRGIDVGSKAEIYRLIQELAAQGKTIVVVSSYLPELLGICDTLAVMHKGKLSPVRSTENWTGQEVMRFATSGTINETI